MKYLEALEHKSALVQASNPDGKRRNVQTVKQGSGKWHKAVKHSQENGKEKFCQKYKNAGRPECLYKNHNTNDGKKGKDNNGKNGRSSHHGSGKNYYENIFALFMEFEKIKKSEKAKKDSKKLQEASRIF